MRFLQPYARKYGVPFLVAIVFLMFEAAADLLLPTIMASVIDDGVASRDMHRVLQLGGLMLLITAGGAVAATLRNVISSHVSQRFGADLRAQLFRHIQSFPFRSIDKFDRSSLMTRLTNDVSQVQNFVNGLMRIFVKAPLICIGSLIMAVNLNPQLSVVLLVVVPIVSLLIYLNMRIGFPLFAKVQQALDRINGVSREYLSGVRVVKAFNRFDHEMAKFDETNDLYRERSTLAARVMAVFGPGVMLTVNFGIVAILWIGGLRVDSGQMQVGHILAFIHYMTQILFSLLMISHVFTMFVRAKASAERIEAVFVENVPLQQLRTEAGSSEGLERKRAEGGSSDSSERIRSGSGPSDSSERVRAEGGPSDSLERVLTESRLSESSESGLGRDLIVFDRVSFAYAGAAGDPVLRDLSFACQAGETVGIIGSTGSGKTTLVNLIPRFYDATSGTIYVDGVDVRASDPHRLRERIAIVPQQSVLFTGTIENNIRWGKEDATHDEVVLAARMAQAEEFILKLPEQYGARLGQGGVNLSGGQKQRLSIARALVRRPDILILDDSTSAVDTATETRIKASLREYAEGITCLIIAQRITSVIDADKIIVLENGEIAGIGKHDELLANCRSYQEIFQSQIGKEVRDNVQATF